MTIYINPEHVFLGLTGHAVKRSSQRGIKNKHVANLLKFGRKNYQNGAVYYSIGKKEISKFQNICPELKEMNGMHLVTATNGCVITLVRNKDFSLLKHR
ncbi:hypothetical protein [Acinetobacter junii]|uniref:hypothetical protein n=1 Tax=Acinetobacter junii TaxID=40215 RepID=UPI00124D58F5|nr:hypothetical protein [Acinetobacter junii]